MREKEFFRGSGEGYVTEESIIETSVSYDLRPDLKIPVELGWIELLPPVVFRTSRQLTPDKNFLKRLASRNRRP